VVRARGSFPADRPHQIFAVQFFEPLKYLILIERRKRHKVSVACCRKHGGNRYAVPAAHQIERAKSSVPAILLA
jgi:hypothetical protein